TDPAPAIPLHTPGLTSGPKSGTMATLVAVPALMSVVLRFNPDPRRCPMAAFCSACGAKLDPNTRFCSSCGQAVEAAPTSAAPSPAQSAMAAPPAAPVA